MEDKQKNQPNPTENETVNPPAEAAVADDDFEALLAEYEHQQPKGGEMRTGRVIAVSRDYVTVDIGFKSEGNIPMDEFIDPKTREASVKPGDVIDVILEDFEDDNGMIVLSKEKADKQKVWDKLEGVLEGDGIIEGMILDRVKGGLSVYVDGIKAFLPGSQVDLRPVRNLEKLIGQTYKFQIIKLNPRRGNLVLSRRALLEKERSNLRAKTVEGLQEGAIVTGTVKNITNYGAFIDLGGIDGLLHITDMSWGRLSHPSQMLQIAEDIQVKVLKYDQDQERVSLGIKQLTEDPWKEIAEKYPIGNKVTGKVVSLAEYGAFIELEDGVEGLIHVSEMSWTRRIKHPSKLLNVGDEVEVVVLDIDSENRRISLGLKQAQPNPWDQLAEKYPPGTVLRGKVRNITDFGLFVGIEEGIDGLVHVSDISWTEKIKHPGEKYKKGEEVEAVVLAVDPAQERFSLGIKQLKPDPWSEIANKYYSGKIIVGKVTKCTDFGVFVQLEEDIEGLVHISELSTERVEDPRKIVEEGQEVKAEVLSVDPQERRLALSIRAVLENEDKMRMADYIGSGNAAGGEAATEQKATTSLGALIKAQLGMEEEKPEAAAEEAAAEEAAAEEAPAKEAPAEEAPAEEVSAKEAPAEEAPAEEVSTKEAPAEEAPAEEAAAEEEPKDE